MRDRDRVLAALRKGPVNSTDFLRPADGGKPVLRVPARVHELRKLDGYEIDEQRQKDRTSTYRLVSEPDEQLPVAA